MQRIRARLHPPPPASPLHMARWGLAMHRHAPQIGTTGWIQSVAKLGIIHPTHQIKKVQHTTDLYRLQESHFRKLSRLEIFETWVVEAWKSKDLELRLML